ncbi:MptD family putative ECF transporter S component [Dactylosporangium sp. NPDC005572]|uniref:MptD family putative ECF transporter S component n=1 Tax=Dactylosporangium sp. NPDC005572 TaxID=3156889 RepID=UPI0033B6AE2D
MSARDLVNIGIFAAIYLVIVFTISFAGVVSPLLIVVTFPLSIIVAGIPYMLFLTRVKHAGMVTIFAVLVAGIYLLAGHPWISTVVTVVAALLAEAILLAGRYRSRWAAILAYAVFSLWFIGPLLPILIDPDEYFSSATMQATPEYADKMRDFLTDQVLWMYNAATFIAGLLGGLLGAALLRKHFRKAGLA